MKFNRLFHVTVMAMWPGVAVAMLLAGHAGPAVAWVCLTPLFVMSGYAIGYEKACEDPPAERSRMFTLLNK